MGWAQRANPRREQLLRKSADERRHRREHPELYGDEVGALRLALRKSADQAKAAFDAQLAVRGYKNEEPTI